MIAFSRAFVARAAAVAFALSAASALLAAPNPTPSASPGLDLSGIDRAVRPGEDFFAHANGAWLKATEIPADRAAYGVGGVVTELTSQRTAAPYHCRVRGCASDCAGCSRRDGSSRRARRSRSR